MTFRELLSKGIHRRRGEGINLNDLREMLATKADRASPNDLSWTIVYIQLTNLFYF